MITWPLAYLKIDAPISDLSYTIDYVHVSWVAARKIVRRSCLGARPRYNLVVDEDVKKPTNQPTNQHVSWRRTVEAEATAMGHSWGTLRTLAQDRLSWREFFAALVVYDKKGSK